MTEVTTLRPRRVRLSRRKGWQMPPNTVKVDRSTPWGNPFFRHGDGYPMDPACAVESFRRAVLEIGSWWPRIPPPGKVPMAPPKTLEDVRRELRGKNLACWCPLDQPCHADVLLEIANAEVR